MMCAAENWWLARLRRATLKPAQGSGHPRTSSLLRRVLCALSLALLFSVFSSSSQAASASNTLTWNAGRDRLTADFVSGNLVDVLKRVASATGWQVYLEPGTEHSVSAKFKDLPPGEGLRLLLGDVSFAVIPVTNGASKLLVFRTSTANATQQIRPEPAAPAAKVIPNELIVRLKPGANIDEIAKKLGAKVVGRMDKLNAYRLSFDDEGAANSAREQLAANSDVESIESNYSIDRPATPSGLPVGAAPLQLQMRPPPDSGRVILGLIDTAVQPLGNNLDQFLLKQISLADGGQLDPSAPSHGTAMAETILRSLQEMSKGQTSVQIQPIDIYGGAESTSTFKVAEAIVEAVNRGAKVVNLSLGSPGDSQLLSDVVQNAIKGNVVLIAAPGNTPVTTPYYPAAYPGVWAVTALENGQIAPYANRGSFVSLAAPGTSLVPFGSQTWAVQGTSVSSAFVSGFLGGYLESNPGSSSSSFLQNNFGLNRK